MHAPWTLAAALGGPVPIAPAAAAASTRFAHIADARPARTPALSRLLVTLRLAEEQAVLCHNWGALVFCAAVVLCVEELGNKTRAGAQLNVHEIGVLHVLRKTACSFEDGPGVSVVQELAGIGRAVDIVAEINWGKPDGSIVLLLAAALAIDSDRLVKRPRTVGTHSLVNSLDGFEGGGAEVAEGSVVVKKRTSTTVLVFVSFVNGWHKARLVAAVKVAIISQARDRVAIHIVRRAVFINGSVVQVCLGFRANAELNVEVGCTCGARREERRLGKRHGVKMSSIVSSGAE